MKRITKQQLRERHIFNSYNLARAAGNKLFISYTPAENGRASHCAAWDIVGIDFKTDSAGAWYNYGHKSFMVGSRQDKQPQLEIAMQWVKDNYGITEWERDIFGSYQIKGTLDKITELVKVKG